MKNTNKIGRFSRAHILWTIGMISVKQVCKVRYMQSINYSINRLSGFFKIWEVEIGSVVLKTWEVEIGEIFVHVK